MFDVAQTSQCGSDSQTPPTVQVEDLLVSDKFVSFSVYFRPFNLIDGDICKPPRECRFWGGGRTTLTRRYHISTVGTVRATRAAVPISFPGAHGNMLNDGRNTFDYGIHNRVFG